MALDPSIALQVQPAANPLSQFAQVAQIQNMQTQGKLADAQLQGQQRGVERQNKLAQLLAQGGAPEQVEGNLRQGGFLDESLKFGKDRRENTKSDLSAEESRQKLFTGGLGMIVANPTPETVQAVLDDLEKRTGRPSGPARQIFSQAQTPEQIAELAKRMGIELEKQMPSFQTRNTGGTTDTLSIDPITGKVAVANSVRNTQSPDSIASTGIQRERLNFDKEKDKRDGAAGGKAPAGYRFKPDGTLEAIPGGPADIKAGEAGAKREQMQQGSLAQADRIIAKVDQAMEKVGMNSAGMGGSLMAKIPGTDATNLRTDLDTIKANLGFAELQAMRQASPTGGALGAIAVQELVALQSTVASLDQAQTPAQLKARLGEVRKHYSNWKKAVTESSKPQTGGATGGWDGGDDPLGLRK